MKHDMENIQERLVELEIRYTHLSQQTEELNEEVILCHRRLDGLERENRRLRDALKSLAPDTPESPDE
ncbi:MAG: SlyX family protein [Desulfuromonadales bacterium]